MSQNVRPYKVREAAEYLVTHGKLFKDQGIVFDTNWAPDNGELNNDNEIDEANQNEPESYIDSRVNDIPNEPQPGCSHWNDSLNDTDREDESDNREGQMDFGVTIRGDEIEIDLEPQNVHQKETQNSEREKQNHITENDDEQWSDNEDDQENYSGVLDIMLTSPDFLEDEERDLQYILAPGQGRTPVSVFKDKYSEELAYPNIYCGQNRPDNKVRKVPVYYSEICKSELRHQDRRVAQDPDNIFFKTKKLQMKMMLNKVQIAMRKCKCKDLSLKAGSLKDPVMINDIVFKDIGYKFLNTVRGSPPYFQAVAKDLFAVIRQLGPATFFTSFSAAETRWKHLLRILGKIVDGIDYNDENLDNLTWTEKCRLIQSDPATCARHFDRQVQLLFKFLKDDVEPLGPLVDYFYRVEFQQWEAHIYIAYCG